MGFKTLIGIVTFGNVGFTKLAVRSLRETVNDDYEIFGIVGKSDDKETAEFFDQEGIPYNWHQLNLGFPASINDIYDYAFIKNDFDAYVAIGNDVIALPETIDTLIKVAKETDYEWVCAKEFDVRTLCKSFPEQRKYFKGVNYIFTDFTARPWEVFDNHLSEPMEIDKAGMSDVHNLTLFKKSVFEKIGYVDVNFYPAYFEDNDYCKRGALANITSCTVNRFYFHFWSRTIKQGTGGSTGKFFNMNSKFYQTKWGGSFGHEKYSIPFNGKEYKLGEVFLEPNIKIWNRSNELDIVKYWRSKT